jgi:hypothetical protein
MKTKYVLSATALLIAIFGSSRTASACYNPVLGRWLEQEPSSGRYIDGANLYEFARSRRNVLCDPSGLTAGDCVDMNVSATGPWHFAGEGPGTLVLGQIGNDGINYQIRNVRAWFFRSYVELFKCCDGSDTAYYHWGTPGQQVGFIDSTGSEANGTTEVLAAGGGSPFKIPIGYNKTDTPPLGLPSLPVGCDRPPS